MFFLRQACRFQKCVEAGMKVSWVLTEGERKDRAKQRAVTKKKKQEMLIAAATASTPSAIGPVTVAARKSPAPAATPSPSPTLRTPDDLFTQDDRQHMNKLISATYDFMTLEMCKFYARHVSLYEEVLSSVYQGTGVSQKTQKLFDSFIVYSVKNFYRGMGDMMNLSARDQNVLVSKNYPVRNFSLEQCPR